MTSSATSARNLIDCYGITALEFAKVVDLTDPDSLVLQDYLADGMEYVLIVHDRSKFRSIPDLRGASLVSHTHRDMVLEQPWLATMLADNNLPTPDTCFGSRKLNSSLTQVVLPVFFRRADGACLARRSWETALELNPQLGRDLRILAISPKVIPIAFGFRRNCQTAFATGADRFNSAHFVRGRRTADRCPLPVELIPGAPLSVMKSTLEMLRKYDRVSAPRANSGRTR